MVPFMGFPIASYFCLVGAPCDGDIKPARGKLLATLFARCNYFVLRGSLLGTRWMLIEKNRHHNVTATST